MTAPSTARTVADSGLMADLEVLEHRLGERACWHEDPSAYRQGITDTVAALRQRVEQQGPGHPGRRAS